MKALITATLLLLGLQLSAQNMAGTYTMNFSNASEIFTNRTPAQQTFSGSTTFTVTQSGDEITLTMSGFQGEWSAHRMSGRVGNGYFVAALANGTKSVYFIRGKVSGRRIKGEFSYLRYGNGSSGIVPGWHRVEFTATQ